MSFLTFLLNLNPLFHNSFVTLLSNADPEERIALIFFERSSFVNISAIKSSKINWFCLHVPALE